jgi:hypothetical protein
VYDPDANPATLALIRRLEIGPRQDEFRSLNYLNLITRVPPESLARIALEPDVISIQPCFEPAKLDERQDQIVAGNLSGNTPSGPGYLDWLASKGFTQSQFDASGFVVDISDSGIDNGTNTPAHFGLYSLGDPTRASRVVYNRLEGTANLPSTLQGCDGHGTLNAHILAGYGALSGFPFADSSGFEYGLGVCPFVRIGSSVVFDPDFFTSPIYANLQSEAYQSGARISANSWGDPYANGVYDVKAQAYDALVRDAQPAGSTYAAAGNQQMVIVFAAGNSNSYSQIVQSPASAKNVITVGASENVRSLSPASGGNDPSGNDGCGSPDSGADSAGDMASFSDWGPCTDGRLKPDLVAPGSHITGGAPQGAGPSTNGLGAALGCFNAQRIAALPGAGSCGAYAPGNTNNFFPLGQQFYTVSSGTSQATPAVAGACALLRQHFINHSLPAPSPAMTKACLINSARYLAGAGAGDSLWSTNQGMGALNLAMALDGVPRILHDQIYSEKFTASSQIRTITGVISDPTKPFRVTLAWTDAPGNTTGNAYNNDLDLTVVVGGNTYKGNVFSGAYSTTGGSYDAQNNVESVFLPAGLSGTFAVKVVAADINSDGVPNEAPSLDQDFALAVYNAVEGPEPAVSVDSVALSAENCSPTNGAIDPGETVTLSYVVRNAGSVNTTNLVTTLLMTNGVYWPSSAKVAGALLAGGSSITQAFSFTAVGICSGTITPVLQFQDGAANLGSAYRTLLLGMPVVPTLAATNSAGIEIPDPNLSGQAAPYPSGIVVSGITGTVTKVTVTLYSLTHNNPQDVDLLLAGPSGTNVVLMSGCGSGYSVSGVTLTFDDGAASPLPD